MDAASRLPPPFYLLWCHCEGKCSCCRCTRSFPSHFSQIWAHGRRDLLAIFWVFVETLPHFQSQKEGPLVCVSCRSRIHISRIPKWKQKARPLPKNVIDVSHGTASTAGGWSEPAPGCETVSAATGRFSLSRTRTAGEMKASCWVSRPFSQPAWWKSSCLIHRWP